MANIDTLSQAQQKTDPTLQTSFNDGKTIVLTNQSEAIKFASDEHYDVFVSQFMPLYKADIHLPQIHSHHKVPNENIWVTKMELLTTLTESEESNYSQWLADFYAHKNRNQLAALPDFNGLKQTVLNLDTFYVNYNKVHKVKLVADFVQPKNLMKRGDGTFVLFDPFA
ncbi:hypothetical protein EK599_07850 [Vibrio sp. T187]|uniref:hypothetical protein n=1 Tax=Vibrio TaxID=662 RepID=UPI0010C9F576|nr:MULTISPECIES: hypothetical protein [Vibrio]MBW3695606.1 hypothetical protein [Vibrio sp. T187]